MVVLGELAFGVLERLVIRTVFLSDINEHSPLQIDVLLINIGIRVDSPELKPF